MLHSGETHGFERDTNKAQEGRIQSDSVLESVQKSERVGNVTVFR